LEEQVEPAAAGKRLDPILQAMVQQRASDLHLATGMAPMIRVDGRMMPLPGGRAASGESMRAALTELMPNRNAVQFNETWDTDFGYELAGVSRFRCNVFVDRRGVGAVIRTIPSRVPNCDEIGLPPAVRKLCFSNKGLILVTGPTGSGKSTTLAAMLDNVNANREAHIISIEDPIEFVHENKRCHINQREIGRHTKGFKPALRAALREDPDVVLIGEMRDLETTMIALETAETGHVVFATLHTNSAVSTIDRLINQFPGDQQPQVRMMLADTLIGVISQTLCRRKVGGRVAALEVLLGNYALSNLIRESKSHQISSLIQTNLQNGMQLMGDSLFKLVMEGAIEPMEAVRHATERKELIDQLTKHGYIAKS